MCVYEFFFELVLYNVKMYFFFKSFIKKKLQMEQILHTINKVIDINWRV